MDRVRRAIARAREGEPRLGVVATVLHRIALVDLAIAACADALKLELPDPLRRSIGDEHEWLEKDRRTFLRDADRLGARPRGGRRELGLVLATGTAIGTIATTLFQIARARRDRSELASRSRE